jgi:transcriptional regulator with XRE-family HTH domain
VELVVEVMELAAKNRLREIRHELKVNRQKQFAEMLAVTQSQISLWETQQQQPTIDTYIRLWKRLLLYRSDLNLQDLINYEDLE